MHYELLWRVVQKVTLVMFLVIFLIGENKGFSLYLRLFYLGT